MYENRANRVQKATTGRPASRGTRATNEEDPMPSAQLHEASTDAAPAGDRAATSTDPILVARLAAGDESVLADLYERYGRLVHSMAYRVVRDEQLAEECTQDVFVTLWRQAERGSIVHAHLQGLIQCAAAVVKALSDPPFGVTGLTDSAMTYLDPASHDDFIYIVVDGEAIERWIRYEEPCEP